MARVLKPKWETSLQNTSLDKRTNRTGISPGYLHELVGIDGRLSGGLRPFPGFKLVRKLARTANADYVTTGGNAAPVSNDKPTVVYWMEPFSIRVGPADYATGWVVRGEDNTGTDYMFVEFYYNTQWYFKRIEDANIDGSGPTWTLADASSPIKTVSAGRILYIFQKGRPVIRFYVTPGAPGVINLEHTGPGASEDFPLSIENHSDVALGSGTRIRIVDLGSKSGSGAGRLPIYNDPSGFATENVKTHVQATDTTIGTRSNQLGQIAKGDYVFAYQLYNSTTGARSALSPRVVRRVEDFGSDTVRLFALEIPSGQTETDLQDLQAAWTHIYIYRSLSALDSGGAMTSSLLFEEAFVSIEDATGTGDDATYIVNGSQTSIGEGNFIYWFELSDNAIVMKPTYRHNAVFEEQMPYAGAAAYYEGVMVVSNIETGATVSADDEVRTGVGEIRWSSLGENSVEVFPPDNRFVPSSPGEGPIQFNKLGDRVIGLGPSRNFMVYKSGAFIAIKEMLEGYGVASRRGSTVVANSIYVATDKGLVAVDSQGGLDPIRGLDYVFMDEWVGSLSSVRVSFDHRMGCLFVLNVLHKKAYLVWSTTSMISSLYHMSFSDMGEGFFPGNETQSRRAFFILDDGRVFVPDAGREMTYPKFIENSLALSVLNSTVDTVDSFQITIPGVGNDIDLIGSYVVPLSGSAVGQHYLITGVASDVLTLTPNPLVAGLTSNDLVSIGPVFTKLGLPAVGLENQEGETFGPINLFRNRHVDGIGVHFTGVETPSGTELTATYRAYLLKGLDDTEVASATPQTNDGDDYAGLVDSTPTNYAQTGEFGVDGPLLFPMVEVASTGVDYLMLGVKILGSIQNEIREGRAS